MDAKLLIDDGLYEREADIAAIVGACDRVDAGAGQVLVIAGAAGIGKSSLVAVAAELGRARGWDVLQARGGELERGAPFGLALELFEDRVARAPIGERKRLLAGPARHVTPVLGGDGGTRTGNDALAAIVGGLCRLAMNLAQEYPLLLAVDDAQWADAQSLRWMASLAGRLDDAQILLLAASREPEPDALGAIAAERVRPAALSRHAVARVVRAAHGDVADVAFCAACHEASGGNPFYLRELVTATNANGVAPVAASAGRVLQLTTDTVAASMLVRLRAAGPQAIAFAEALAVLGINSECAHVADLAGLDPGDAETLVERLAAARILRSDATIDFAHPVIRATVHAGIAPGRRAALHRAAARVVQLPIRVAEHLMQTDPAGEEWAARALHEAGRTAFGQGATATARRLAARALAEPPAAGERGVVLALLGRAEMLTGAPESVGHLSEALSLEPDGAERTRLVLEALAVLFSRHQRSVIDGAVLDPGSAFRALRDALYMDDEVAIAFFEAILCYPLGSGRSFPEALPEILARLRKLVPHDVELRGWPSAMLAYEAVRFGVGPAGRAVADAERSIAATGPRADAPAWGVAVDVLVCCDQLDAARDAIDAALAGARERGSQLGLITAADYQAQCRLQAGDLRDAADTGRAAIELAIDFAEPTNWFLHLAATTIIALAHAGDVPAAEAVLATVRDIVIATTRSHVDPSELDGQLRYARGHLRVAAGDPAGGAGLLLGVGEELLAWGFTNPGHCEWRSAAVPALVAGGRRAEALALARENLELARAFGAAGPIGRGLHALGLAEEGDARLAALEEAVAVLGATPLRLAHASASVDLGVALRHARARGRAREPLAAGLELAERCGARPLAERARAELGIAGAPPHTEPLAGAAGLTASERRVAQLAASGLTNREISQQLLLTQKTVASHLSNVYRKLGVASRTQLGDALSGAA